LLKIRSNLCTATSWGDNFTISRSWHRYTGIGASARIALGSAPMASSSGLSIMRNSFYRSLVRNLIFSNFV
jgi:hypothetical protein